MKKVALGATYLVRVCLCRPLGPLFLKLWQARDSSQDRPTQSPLTMKCEKGWVRPHEHRRRMGKIGEDARGVADKNAVDELRRQGPAGGFGFVWHGYLFSGRDFTSGCSRPLLHDIVGGFACSRSAQHDQRDGADRH
jgi:hypothetical protein